MKRILILFALVLSLVMAVSCASSQQQTAQAEENAYSEEGEGVERLNCERIMGMRICV